MEGDGMIKRFSRSARAAVAAAVDEAGLRGDARVGTEHLLLGLLHDPGSAAARTIGVDLETARGALQTMDVDALAAVGIDVSSDATGLPRIVSRRARGRRPFTMAAGAVLRRTLAEAQAHSMRRLEATHLLLALLDCGPRDPATQLLDRLGVDPAVVRSRLSDAA
jgi:ATP-dependent Clp protease ATP-binding subunit ClpA